MSCQNVASVPIPREESRWLTPLELGVLGAIWGASFLFMRIAAHDFGPAPLVEVRLALGALVLLPFLWKARAGFPLRLWPKLALIGAINSAAPFLLFAWAAQRAPAGIGAIANAMTVLFTALVGFLFFGERIGGRRAAALLTLPLALATWPAQPVPMLSWLSAAMLGVLCTGIAFVMYYRLIARVGASRASTVTYLVPLFGVAWAWLLLGEPLTWTMAAAGALILGSVAFSQGARR